MWSALIFVLIFVFLGNSQELSVQNPSFETGHPLTGSCKDANGNDVLSAYHPAGDWCDWPAAHGDWYNGLVCDEQNYPGSESIAQPLSAPFSPGVTYTFDISLANVSSSYMIGSFPLNQPGTLFIIGSMGGQSNDGCLSVSSDDHEILWQSPEVSGKDWKTYDIEFVPSKAWTHVWFTMSPHGTCVRNNSNIFINKIGSFFPGGLKIVSPQRQGDLACSQLIEGVADE